jgi:transposase-like protein
VHDKLTISTAQLLALFPDEEAARHYIESRRWPNGPRCPVCASDRIGAHSPGFHRCLDCVEPFTVRTGTVMERSKIGLREWLRVLASIAAGNRVTSPLVAEDIGVRQPTAWALLKRIELALKWWSGQRLDPPRPLDHVVDRLLSFSPPAKSAPGKRRARDKAAVQAGAVTAVRASRRAANARHPLHYVWATMIQRCTNPRNRQYRHYGGRGITVCQPWLESFERFVADMGPRPARHTIERVNNDGHYEPRNCKWATYAEQAKNKRPQSRQRKSSR